MGNFKDIISKLNKDFEATLRADNQESYGRMSTIFEELEKYTREYIQDISDKDIKDVLRKLRGGMTLTADDRKWLKLWIVGDAEYYAQMENDVSGWKSELQRIMGEINAISDDPSVETASRLRSLLRDGSRVLTDLFYFTSQKDRVKQFTESTQEIDENERVLLVRLLENKLNSSEF